ncbi:9016_t:CDS:2, partial [Paraglomus brasilianum]
FASTLLSVYKVQTDSQRILVSPGISQSNFREGLGKCMAIMKQRPENTPRMTRHNPRAVPGTKSVLLKNGIILDGVGGVVHGDLLMKNGIIEKFGKEIDEGEADITIDVRGKFISPGIVDMHSHAGVYSWPYLRGSMDINELTDPITPFVRAIDSINPSDP